MCIRDRYCPICAWRRGLIVGEVDATDAPEGACDSEVPHILEYLHAKPSQVWIAIISTNRLCSPRPPVVREGRKWVCIPLRCDRHVEWSNNDYMYKGCHFAKHETVIGFHNTLLGSLVSATPTWNGPIGNGILVDGRFVYGNCSHNRNNGVNIYSDGGLETFDERLGWVQLEVICTNTRKLRGGRENRYCINGPAGKPCFKVAIMNLWVLEDQFPPIVALS